MGINECGENDKKIRSLQTRCYYLYIYIYQPFWEIIIHDADTVVDVAWHFVISVDEI